MSTFTGLVLHHENHQFENEEHKEEKSSMSEVEETYVLPHHQYGHVILSKPSPILLYQISSTETRVLVDMINKPKSQDMKSYLLDSTLPQLPTSMQEVFRTEVEERYCNEEALDYQLRSMDNKCHPSTLFHTSNYFGLWLLGDSNNMRHALTGSGMSVLLQDVELATNLLKEVDQFEDMKEVRKAMLEFVEERKKSYATTINVLATALHQVMSDPLNDGNKEEGEWFDGTSINPSRNDLREACFNYLDFGGHRTRGPVNLLGCITIQPWVLILHFFLVAFYAIYFCLFKSRTFDHQKNIVIRWRNKMRHIVVVLRTACGIIFPLLASEKYSMGGIEYLADLFLGWSRNPVTMKNRY